MFRLFQNILNCGDCKKKKAEDVVEEAAEQKDNDKLVHERSLSFICGSMGSSACTSIGGVIISGAKGKIKINVPGYDSLVFQGHRCSANKYQDGHGNVAVDILVHPAETLVRYTSKDSRLTVTNCQQPDMSNGMRPY